MCQEGIASVTYIMVSSYNNDIMFISQRDVYRLAMFSKIRLLN